MNICFLSIHSSPIEKIGTRDNGGMSVYLLETAKQLSAKGHCVDIFSFAGEEKQSLIHSLSINIRLILLGGISSPQLITKENLIDFIPELFQEFLKITADDGIFHTVVHSHYWLSGVLGEMVCRSLDVPHLITFHTLGAVKNKACGNLNEPSLRVHHEKMLIQKCDRIISFTQEEKDNLVSLYDADAAKIDIVPCGVNQDVFYPFSRDESRRQLAIPDGKKMILFVGRFVEIKGIDILLSAVALLREDNLLTYLVGGDDRDIELLKRRVDRDSALKKKDCVFFPGRLAQRELLLYYAAADALIIPSYHESFCLVALEALSCGTPVIASAVGGIPEILQQGAGVQVRPCTPETVADAIVKMLFTKEIVIKSEKVLRQSVAMYSWSRTAVKLIHIYKSILLSFQGDRK